MSIKGSLDLKREKREAFYKQCSSLCDELGVTVESGRGEAGCLLNRKRVINIFCPTDRNYSHWLKKNKHPSISPYGSQRMKFDVISNSGIVWTSCYFITPSICIYFNKLIIVICVYLTITCLCSAFSNSFCLELLPLLPCLCPLHSFIHGCCIKACSE